MELRLTLRVIAGCFLPTNYQYPVASWIYKVISRADENHSKLLHETGFQADARNFKMFTFSQMDLRPYNMLGDQIRLLGTEVSLVVRFMIDASLENFVKGLFLQQRCALGDQHTKVVFEVTSVETLVPPVFASTVRYHCLSPIVVSSRRQDGSIAYLTPDDPGFSRNFLENLRRKHRALAIHAGHDDAPLDDSPLHFRLLNTPRKKGITIKAGTDQETKVIGYLFNFEVTAAPELHEIGYFAGFGEKNSMGFGCVALAS